MLFSVNVVGGIKKYGAGAPISLYEVTIELCHNTVGVVHFLRFQGLIQIP